MTTNRLPDIRSARGGALVELALVAPIFVALIVGSAALGRLAYAAITVSHAARAGAAYGAQNHATASDVTGMKSTAALDGADVGTLKVYAGPCVCPASAATSTVLACTGSFISGTGAISYPFSGCPTLKSTTEFVQVNTQAVINNVFRLPGLPVSYTLNGTATLVVEQ